MSNNLSNTGSQNTINPEMIEFVRRTDEAFCKGSIQNLAYHTAVSAVTDLCKYISPRLQDIIIPMMVQVTSHYVKCVDGSNVYTFFALLKDNKVTAEMFYHLHHHLCGDDAARTIAVVLGLDARVIKENDRVKIIYGGSIDVELDWTKLAKKLAKYRPGFKWDFSPVTTTVS